MNVYIGYKYRKIKDKESLKENLFKISNALTSLNHKTFILGRDAFKWNHHGRTSKSVAPIVKNMKKSDVFFAIVGCDSKSHGLLFESLCAKLFGKKIILAVKKGSKKEPFNKFTKAIIEFEDYEGLAEIILSDLEAYL